MKGLNILPVSFSLLVNYSFNRAAIILIETTDYYPSCTIILPLSAFLPDTHPRLTNLSAHCTRLIFLQGRMHRPRTSAAHDTSHFDHLFVLKQFVEKKDTINAMREIYVYTLRIYSDIICPFDKSGKFLIIRSMRIYLRIV